MKKSLKWTPPLIPIPLSRRYIDTGGSGLVSILLLQIQASPHITKGTLVNFVGTHSPANPAMKKDDFYEFTEDRHWFISQKLGSKIARKYIEKIENALFIDSLANEWSIILHNSQLYAVHNTDIHVVQSP